MRERERERETGWETERDSLCEREIERGIGLSRVETRIINFLREGVKNISMANFSSNVLGRRRRCWRLIESKSERINRLQKKLKLDSYPGTCEGFI